MVDLKAEGYTKNLFIIAKRKQKMKCNFIPIIYEESAMSFNSDDYGSRIRSLRKNRGLTQEQLAEKMNVSTPYIAKIENGKQTGPVELAVEFAEFFEVPLDYLLVGKGDFAEEQKRRLRMAISLLSKLEASL